MREVAELAGVAMSSVSRVLSGHPDVSQRMRQRVEAAVDQLEYQPDMLAQSLRRRATLSVGCLVGEIADPFVAELLQGVEGALRDAGYALLLARAEPHPGAGAGAIRRLQQRRVDGLLLAPAGDERDELAALLEAAETPAVLIDDELPDSAGASAVLCDHGAGMRAAIEHLLGLGHSRIGLVVDPRAPRAAHEQRAVAAAAVARAGALLVEDAATPYAARHAVARLLDRADPPTALVAGSGTLLLGALQELGDRGLQVGAGVSLVGCDAPVATALCSPPVAAIERDARALGREAAHVLLRQIGGASAPEQVELPTTFVARASCAPA